MLRIARHLCGLTSFPLSAFLLGVASAGAEPPVRWAPRAASAELSPGSSQTLLVKFSSADNLKNVQVSLVPSIAKFVTANPATFASVIAGVSYDVHLEINLPGSVEPGAVFEGALHLRHGGKRKVAAMPLPVAIVVKDSPSTLNDVVLYGEPGAPELLSFQTKDGEVVTFYGTKDENAITTSVTSLLFQGPGPESKEHFAFFKDGRPSGFRTPEGAEFGLSWISDTQLLASVITPDGAAQANVSITLPQSLAFTSTVKDLTETDPSAVASLQYAIRKPLFRVPSPATPELVFAPKPSLTSDVTVSDLVVAMLTANVTACGQPMSGAFVTAKFTGPSGGQYGGLMDEEAPGVYQRQFPNFSSAISPETIINGCKAIVEPIADACSILPAGGPSLSDIMIDGGGCVALATAAAAIGGVSFPAVLAGCVATVKVIDIACGLANPDAVCSAISAVNNFFDPDGVDVEVTASAPKFAPVTKSMHIAGSVAAASIDLPLSGPPAVQSFTTSPVDPAPFQSYVANATLTCVGSQSAITLTITGTDGYTDSTTCGAASSNCSLSVPGAEEGVIDTISVSVGGTILRTIQLVF